MQKDSHFFEDLAKLTSGAAGAMMNMKREFESMIADKLAGFMAQHQFVTREEFEVVRAMAQKAREENEALKKEIEQLRG
jgi:BMFP domain-containing protein YqiC